MKSENIKSTSSIRYHAPSKRNYRVQKSSFKNLTIHTGSRQRFESEDPGISPFFKVPNTKIRDMTSAHNIASGHKSSIALPKKSIQSINNTYLKTTNHKVSSQSMRNIPKSGSDYIVKSRFAGKSKRSEDNDTFDKIS